MKKGLKFSGVAVLLFLLLFVSGCSDSVNDTDGDTDGDTDNSSTDGDGEGIENNEDGDSDIELTENEAEEEMEDFVYSGCAKINETFQYPTPMWEVEADTDSGVKLVPPANDKAALLLKDEKESWFDDLTLLDGFPLMGSWFIALSEEATSVDSSKIRFFKKSSCSMQKEDCDKTPVEVNANIDVALSEDNKTIMIESVTPLAPLNKGEHYIIALYSGITEGAEPLPACKNNAAHHSYVDAANTLVLNSFGDNLLYAMPFTPENEINLQAELYDTLISGNDSDFTLAVETMVEHDSYEDAVNKSCTKLVEWACTKLETDIADGGSLKAVIADKSYSGIFNLPNLQDENGHFEMNTSLEGETFGFSKPGYYLVLPKNGTAPYPVVLFQHGGSRYKEDLLTIAEPYLENGFAMMGIDLPYHGDRATDKGVYDMADMAAPIKTRDNFRQASLDHLGVLTGIANINTELDKLTGLTDTLDSEKVFYVGHSMGSLSGTITNGVGNIIKGANLIAGGASFRVLLSDGMYGLMIYSIINRDSLLESKVLLGFLQTLMDAGDPVNYPVNFADTTTKPKDVLLWEIMNTVGNTSDPAAINIATELQARVFGAALVNPEDSYPPAKLVYEVDGLETMTLPISDNFQLRNSENTKATRTLTEVDKDLDVTLQHMDIFLDPISHKASAKCFKQRLDEGSCTLTLE